MSVGNSTASGTRARDLLTVDRRRVLVTFGAAILVFLVGAFLHPGFASAASVKAILVIASFVGLVAAGQTFVLLVGGIDLCHGRRDDSHHRGDPQTVELNPRYGQQPPWHDLQLEIRGPAVGDLAHTFRERWSDPTPFDHRNPARIALRAAS